VIFKNLKNDYSLFIRLLITVGAGLISLSAFYPILSFLNNIASGTKVQEYFPVLIKALGISLLVQITSDICNDSGEASIAHRVEMVGKAEIILLCIPLIKEILLLCEEII
jgi:stage III sporulation protein AD